MLSLDLSRQAAKFLQGLPAKHARQIGGKIVALRENPEPPDSSMMKGEASLYRRTDIGEYRVVYRVEDETLRVFVIGKRNDDEVYRLLRREL